MRLDYLMKPVEEARLADTLERVRARLTGEEGRGRGRTPDGSAHRACPRGRRGTRRPWSDDAAPSADRYEKIINIKDRNQIFRVEVDTIERVEAAGDYMCIYTAENSLILRETMKDLERRLDPRRFQRIHRSQIVNLDHVKQVKPHTNGECFLLLDSGAQVKVSRSYREVVARFVH